MIYDINNGIDSDVSLFADDTRVIRPVKNHSDVEALQDEQEKLYPWQEVNNMAFNSNKFEVLRYGWNQEIRDSTEYFTPNSENFIERKECLRDLGIRISDDAKFSSHIEYVVSKVRQKCGWNLRTFNCRNTQFLKFMWKSLVQGYIYYCSQLYFPTQI